MKLEVMNLMLVGAAAASLTACGSSNATRDRVTIGESENRTRVYAASEDGTTVRDFGQILQDGETLTARKVSVMGQKLNYATGETSLDPKATASVRQNSNGELTVRLNGNRQIFTSADRRTETDGRQYGYEVNPSGGGYAGAFSHSGELDDFLSSGNGYAKVLKLQRDLQDPDNPGLHETAYAVFGAETRDDALTSLPTATYSGRTRVDVVPNSGFVNGSSSSVRVRSDLAMTADFDGGNISGKMTGFTQQNPASGPEVPVAGTMTMERANFDVNGFSGNLTADNALTSALDTTTLDGTYSGAFYGPEANEVAGAIGVTGTAPEIGGFNGAGYFVGSRD